MLNKYPALCAECGVTVAVGYGRVIKGAKWETRHVECPRDLEDTKNAEAFEYRDEDAADAYAQHCMEQAWQNAERGATVQSAWYDTTTYTVRLPDGVSAAGLDRWLNRDSGRNAAAYGKFGGYNTYRAHENPAEPGTARVESVYHIGD